MTLTPINMTYDYYEAMEFPTRKIIEGLYELRLPEGGQYPVMADSPGYKYDTTFYVSAAARLSLAKQGFTPQILAFTLEPTGLNAIANVDYEKMETGLGMITKYKRTPYIPNGGCYELPRGYTLLVSVVGISKSEGTTGIVWCTLGVCNSLEVKSFSEKLESITG